MSLYEIGSMVVASIVGGLFLAEKKGWLSKNSKEKYIDIEKKCTSCDNIIKQISDVQFKQGVIIEGMQKRLDKGEIYFEKITSTLERISIDVGVLKDK